MNKFWYALLQILKMLCYVGLYFGVTILITIGVELVYGIRQSLVFAAAGSQRTEALLEELTEEVMDAVYAAQGWITFASAVVTLLILWLFFVIRKKKLAEEIQLRRIPGKYFPVLILCALGMWMVIEFGMPLLPIPEELWEAYTDASGVWFEGSMLSMIIGAVLTAPVIEEIVVRGLGVSRLRRAMPLWLATLLSSLLFGVIHGQLLWAAYASLLGVILCLVSVWGDSVVASITVHLTFNILGTLVSALLPEEIPVSVLVMAVGAGLVIAVGGLVWFRRMTKQETRREVSVDSGASAVIP